MSEDWFIYLMMLSEYKNLFYWHLAFLKLKVNHDAILCWKSKPVVFKVEQWNNETTVLLFEPYILMTYKIVFVYLNNFWYYLKLKITKI